MISATWPREIPVEGEPADVSAIAAAYADWLATTGVPKLFVKGEPGWLISGGANLDFARGLPAQTEVTVAGVHHLQEDSPDEIGRAIAGWMGRCGTLQGESAIVPGFPLLFPYPCNGRYIDIRQKEKSDGYEKRSFNAGAEGGKVRSCSARQRHGIESRCMDECGARKASCADRAQLHRRLMPQHRLPAQ
jgi:hypothetical protein